MDDLTCIDGPADCAGPVEWRTTSDRHDGKHFRRCEAHGEAREAKASRNLELQSDVAPAWFDPSYAGERWDEE